MKVKELIEILKTKDQDSVVLTHNHEFDSFAESENVNVSNFYKKTNGEYVKDKNSNKKCVYIDYEGV